MARKTPTKNKKLVILDKSADWTKRRDIPLTFLAWLALLFIIGSVLLRISHALIIIIIAAVVAYALVPPVNFFKRFVPRITAIIIVYILLIGFINLLIYVVFSTAVEQITLLIQNGQKFLIPSSGSATSPLVNLVKPFGISEDQLARFGQQLTTQLENLFSSFFPVLTSIFSSIIDIIVTIVVSIYFLLDGHKIILWVRKNVPDSQQKNLHFFLFTLQRIVGAYITGQLVLSISIGLLVGLGMFLLNIPYAVLLGVLAFFLSFIPIIGTFISGAACVLLALTKGWVLALVVLGYFILVHILEGNVIGPRVVGRALGLHPLVALLAVLTGAQLYGVIGALFAAPVAGIIQTILSAVWTEWKVNNSEQFTQQKKLKLLKKKSTHH